MKETENENKKEIKEGLERNKNKNECHKESAHSRINRGRIK
jgi:hypothetical protein